MDVLAAVLACSLYPADDALVRALAESNSHGNPYFVFDPTIDPSQGVAPSEPRSVAQALARAQEVAAKQAVPLLGLLEVPPAWLAAFGRELSEAFDPCTNVAVGSAYLAAFESECARGTRGPSPSTATGRSDRRACVLRRYADALQMPDLVTVVTLELRFQTPRVRAIFEAPIFPPVREGAWGPQQIFAPLDPPPLPPTASSSPPARGAEPPLSSSPISAHRARTQPKASDRLAAQGTAQRPRRSRSCPSA
jgi:hypothetical protein